MHIPVERKTLDSCGKKRKGRDPTGEAEEIEKRKRLEGLGAGAGQARLPPRGKQLSGAKWNAVLTVISL
jgi:hypothetical protein